MNNGMTIVPFLGSAAEAKEDAILHLIRAKAGLQWGGMDALKLITARNEMVLAMDRLDAALRGDLT